jgi:predicted RNA-binding protein with PUA-like domain
VAAWLLKTEPGEFSFADLVRRQVEPWDGVRNTTALAHLRAAAVGDRCVIYHSGTDPASPARGSLGTGGTRMSSAAARRPTARCG